MRYNSDGVPQNYAEGVKWYRLAAEQGIAVAQAILGLMYDTSQGVPQNYAEAVKWYRLAAERGYASAQYIRKYPKIWSHGSDSNRRPAVYETAALPTELPWLEQLTPPPC